MAERYGEYELVKHIATGGMAEIYLARQTSLAGDLFVIVKRMLPQLSVRPDFVQMFLDEARLTASFSHDNIVRVFSLGEVAQSFYIAMELVDGPHLGSLFAHSLRQRNPLPIEICAYIIARSADGLHYAHEQVDPQTGAPLNLVHRDISPQNILVGRNGDVKVSDFGVAKATTQQTKTRTGVIKGKVAYMSPEQCLGDALDRRTDVFALGIVLYELLTRRRLFREKSDLLIMQRITGEDVPPPSTVNPQVDPGLDAIIKRAMSRDRDARYATAGELAEALDAWLRARAAADGAGMLRGWFEQHALALSPTAQLTPEERAGNVDPQLRPVLPATTSASSTATTPALPAQRRESLTPARDGSGASAYSEGTPTPRSDGGFVERTAVVRDRSRPNPVAVIAPPAAATPAPPTRRSTTIAIAAAASAALALGGVALLVIRSSSTEPLPTTPAPLVGRVHIETVPAGIPVVIDGKQLAGKAPLDVTHAPGTMTVTAQFPDQPPRTVDVVVDAVRPVVAHIAARVPLVVTSTPSRAKVRINGELRGETPLPAGVLVEPGVSVQLRLEPASSSYAAWEQSLTPPEGAPFVVEATLVKAEKASPGDPAPASGSGTLSLRTQPWTTAKLGGEKLGEAMFSGRKVRAGKATLALTNPDLGINESLSVVVPKDGSLTIDIRFEKVGDRWKIARQNIR